MDRHTTWDTGETYSRSRTGELQQYDIYALQYQEYAPGSIITSIKIVEVSRDGRTKKYAYKGCRDKYIRQVVSLHRSPVT